MNTGRPPFQNANKMQILKMIATKRVDFSLLNNPSPMLESLIRMLLHPIPHKRIGGREAGIEDIKNHPFFFGIDWD